ncbi:MAG: hypothetical protein PUC62_02165 [Oscillospiraceae bacterium]|nr:hypothetical protein [Oscillospiraceae bacterium]
MKKSLKAKTPWLHCKYFERSARLIVDGCRFNSLAILCPRRDFQRKRHHIGRSQISERKLYESSYLPRIKSEAKQKGKKGKEFDSYVKQKFVKLVEGETRARFMQTAFSSQSILQSLAVETPELLERAKQSVNDSSVAELTDTMWDYERLVILDRINKALTAPVSAETNKEKNSESVESALLALDEDRRNQYNPPTNSGVKNDEAVSNSGANLHDFDGGSERRYTESRGKDGDGALGVGEENQGRVGGSESSQEPRAVEIVSKWLDRGSDETQMLLDSFGSEEAFAKRFLSEYDSGLYSFARSAAESFAGQFVPTVFGQVARSIDPTRRTTYAPKDSAAGKKAATFINKMENKIPGLSQKNAAYVDLWGRTETNNGDTFVGRLFMNSVAPTYVRTVNKTKADGYITQLFAKTGDNSIIPKSPESSYTVSGETFYLTSQEYQQTKELVGQLSHVGVTSLLSVPGFAELSAEDQADLVSDVYSFAKRVAKEDYAYANGIEISVDNTNTKIKNAVLAGMSIGEAVYVYKMANLVEGEKNSKGNTISGSKKANLLSFYRTMGLTNEQINAIKPSNYDFDL